MKIPSNIHCFARLPIKGYFSNYLKRTHPKYIHRTGYLEGKEINCMKQVKILNHMLLIRREGKKEKYLKILKLLRKHIRTTIDWGNSLSIYTQWASRHTLDILQTKSWKSLWINRHISELSIHIYTNKNAGKCLERNQYRMIRHLSKVRS